MGKGFNPKRKLCEADGAAVIAARLRKDLTALFELPCVPLDVVPAPQVSEHGMSSHSHAVPWSSSAGGLHSHSQPQVLRHVPLSGGLPLLPWTQTLHVADTSSPVAMAKSSSIDWPKSSNEPNGGFCQTRGPTKLSRCPAITKAVRSCRGRASCSTSSVYCTVSYTESRALVLRRLLQQRILRLQTIVQRHVPHSDRQVV